MQAWKRKVRFVLAGLVLAACHTQAQTPYGPADEPETGFAARRTGYPKPDRKQPSFWRRAPRADAPEAQLRKARSYAEDGRHRRAARAADALVRHWHESAEAIEAQQFLAAINAERNRLPAAFEAYQYLIVYYPGRFDYNLVVERQFQIARTLRERLERRLNFGPGTTRVREKFARVVANAPHGPHAPEAQMAVGALYEAEGDLDAAISAYESLGIRHSGHPLARQAVMHAARCRHELALKHPRNEVLTIEALASLYGILQSDPGHPDADRIRTLADGTQRRLEELHYEQAAFYDRKQRNPRAARVAYTEFLRRFPDARQAGKVRQRIQELERIITEEANEKDAP